MTSEAESSVLRRKASVRKAAVGPSAMDTAKAMRFAMAKAGDVVLQIAVGVRDVSEDTHLPDGLSEDLPDQPLTLHLQDEKGAIGVAICCLQTVSAIIEASTIGTVLPVEAAERKPTRTDAALVGRFLTRFLSGFEAFAAECDEMPPVEGFKSAGVFADIRAAQMAMADVTHRRYRVTLDFGLGAKVGTLILVFPNKQFETPNAMRSAEEWSEAMEKAVLGTSVSLQAVLCTVKLPVADITGFAIGDVVPLQKARLDGLQLIGSTGKKVMRAKLGRAGSMRAVRLMMNEPDEEPGLTGLDALAVEAAADMAMGTMALPPASSDPPGLALPGGLPDVDAAPMESPGLDLNGPSLGDIGGDPPGLPDVPGLGDMDLGAVGGDDPPGLPDIGLDLPDAGDGLPGLPDIDLPE